MKVQLFQGADAFVLLSDKQFQVGWEMLHRACPWSTVFQAPAFIVTWYEVFRDLYTPVLIVGRDSDGSLSGLFHLAASLSSKEISVAGTHHAEYQVWLAIPEQSNDFIEMCLNTIGQAFNGATLRLMYLPAAAPLTWLEQSRWRNQCTIQPIQRPLIAIGDGSPAHASLAKKRYRSRIKRLEQTGGLMFETLSGPRDLAAVFDEIIDLVDFRHGAAHQSLPFRNNRHKRLLYEALMQTPDLLLVTVLKHAGRIISAHVDFRNGNELALATITHSPFQAEHSPGTLHMLMLSLELARLGIETIDLTPGSGYKDRLATHYDEVSIVTFYFNRITLRKRTVQTRIVESGRMLLRSFKVNPSALSSPWLRFRQQWQESGLGPAVCTELWADHEVLLFAMNTEQIAGLPRSNFLESNSLAGLLACRALDGRSGRTFLSQALRRLEKGASAFTRVEEGQALQYCWLMNPVQAELLPDVDIPDPPNSAVLFDFYAKATSDAREMYSQSLYQVLHDAAALPGVQTVYIAAPGANQMLRLAVECAGARLQSRWLSQTRFGKKRVACVFRS